MVLWLSTDSTDDCETSDPPDCQGIGNEKQNLLFRVPKPIVSPSKTASFGGRNNGFHNMLIIKQLRGASDSVHLVGFNRTATRSRLHRLARVVSAHHP